ncbi:class I adenylate-forming enzyme family protein [Spongiactinospora sp. TRM90649]|uniref:class I adenylate-forming enzyme family protein n=1 Tax=Spongiactinospora sp. TRM90649 TaxID=3031114 RepID=UPI0023F8D40E|nr:class I adenylate-forming enzyme family protein [Spongiactinospora sp. TRM90649]MDF5753564.1 class I adenylate-forming enzyme family protein [Spongiactinospora sp. TRM90649]
MTLSARALLTMDQRQAFAKRQGIGGGNLLTSAIESSPAPDARFIRSARPLTRTDGSPQSDFSLLELDQLAQSWAVWYLNKGVAPRDRVAVYTKDSFAYAIHYFALSSIGAVALLINSNSPCEIAASLLGKTSPVGLYTDREHLARLGDEIDRQPSLGWIQLEEELPAPPPAVLPAEARWKHNPEDPVSIMHSSGTTGLPKPVTQTHRSSVAGPLFRLTIDDPTLTSGGGAMLTAMPQSHLGNIHYSTYAIFGGTPVIPAFDPSPRELVELIKEHRPTSVMGFGHTCVDLATFDLEPGVLDSVGHWVTTADAVHYDHILKVLGHRSPDLPPSAWLDRLGTTELGWAVLLKVTTLASERNDRCVGKPVGVSEVAVLRKDGTPCEVGEVGLLGARGPAITAGYWNDSDTSYRSRLGGYWCPGDMVYRDADDNFYHVDRAVDTIETAEGTGYSVLMEETILSDVADIKDVAVVAATLDGKTVAVGATTAENADPRRLLAEANTVLAAAGHPPLTVLEIVDALPVGVTGKVLKRRLRERYAELDEVIRTAGSDAVAVSDAVEGVLVA